MLVSTMCINAEAVATAYHISIIWVTDYNEYSQSIHTINSTINYLAHYT